MIRVDLQALLYSALRLALLWFDCVSIKNSAKIHLRVLVCMTVGVIDPVYEKTDPSRR